MGEARDPTFLTRVVLRNYRSIEASDVRLGPLMFLVGPNGAGKSNFLDALRFVADGLQTSLDHALRDRGGYSEVRRRLGGHSTYFGMRLEFRLRDGTTGYYAFRIAGRQRGGYEVEHEVCSLRRPDGSAGGASFTVHEGLVVSSVGVAPAAVGDRLYLVSASGLPEFRPVFDALSHIGIYNLNPDHIRKLQQAGPGDILLRDGSNLASAVERLAKAKNGTKQRIEEYLEKVVPEIGGVDVRRIGRTEELLFRLRSDAGSKRLRFPAGNMSDGTLRALGILVALFQAPEPDDPWIPLVGIEEPEVALHPAAVGVLLGSLRDASSDRQVIVTSHSPDLLDDKDIDSDSLLAVVAEDGMTAIGPLDEVGRSVLRDRLYTAGELLRMDQLAPVRAMVVTSGGGQPQLFENGQN